MIDEKAIREMENLRGRVSKEMRSKVSEIIGICERYRFLAERFTFDKDKDLDDEVNRILIALSDAVLGLIMSSSLNTLDEEDDSTSILAYISRERNGEDLQTRLDKHASNLKTILEAWVAIGFVKGLNANDIARQFFVNINNPSSSSLWREAYRQGNYDATILDTPSPSFGKGVLISSIEGMTITGQTAIAEAYQAGVLSGFTRMGAIGYKVHRGSNYPCDICDEACIGIHPIGEQVLPVHPRCMCYSTPVYANDLDMLS